MKKVSKAVAGIALACGLAAPASAAPLSLTVGEIKITFNAFDAGTVGYQGSGVVCKDAESCDKAGLLKSPGAIGSEDTWGIFSVESITRERTGEQFFTAGQNGQYLTGVFGGLTDVYAEVNGTNIKMTSTLSEGGWLRMYLNDEMYDGSEGPGGRIGSDGYKGITDIGGMLALDTVFAPNAIETPDGIENSYASTFFNDGETGFGSGYLDVIGGAWAAYFDTNSQKNGRDLLLTTSFDNNNGQPISGWTVDASGHVEGNIGEVPEPGSLALLGLGFAGLAGLRRRRAAK